MSEILREKLNSTMVQNGFEKNLQRFLNWGNDENKILKKSFGFLKGLFKKSPVYYQQSLRKEWERKNKK